ncbi:hypothetical protein ACGFOM_18155 [Streptomyces sp. NPDC048594]|uniref:hypothetical protein n=1 Tax=Streptomyces sp. NPDC048594 TaxID=3365575 RepID=UPI0037141399
MSKFDGSRTKPESDGWKPRPTCTGKTKRGPCKNPPIKGGTVCKFHGGSAPQVQAAARERLADADRRTAMERWGKQFGELAPHADPAVVMAELIREARGNVRFLLERVNETEAGALVYGLSSEVQRDGGEFPGVDTTYAAEVNGWVRLYSEERDRLVRMIAVAAKMGIDERLVTLAEVQTKMMFAALNRAFDALGLTPEQRARVPQIMPGILRSLSPGEGTPDPAA